MQEGNVVLQKSLLFGCGTDASKQIFVCEHRLLPYYNHRCIKLNISICCMN